MVSPAAWTDSPGMFKLILLLSLFSSAPADLSIPFQLDGRFGSILVTAKVNGRDATFLLDTGAASTMVAAELAGIDRNRLERSRFRKDTGFEANGIWERAHLDLGGWRDSRLVGAVDLSAVSKQYGRKIDGLLGQDVLQEFGKITIDFAGKKLVLSK